MFIYRFFIFFIFINIAAYSQENAINISTSKFNNTYENKGIFNYKTNNNFGEFEVNNNYAGTIITNIHNVFRDIEDFNFNYRYSLWDSIFVISETKYNLISDRNNLITNKLEKISEQIGFSAFIFDKLFIKAIYGLQYNKQSNLQATGSLINTSLKLNEISFDGWNITGAMINEHLILNDSRSASDINVNSQLEKQFSANESFNFELRYKRRSRDFIQSINTPLDNSTKNYAIENNNENRIEGTLNTKFDLIKDVFVNLDGNIGLVDVSRKYQEHIISVSNSKIGRNYTEWLGNINAAIDFKHNIFSKTIFSHNIGIGLDNRNEHYYLSNIHNMDLTDFNKDQLLETQKDNNTFTYKLFYNPTISITKRDTLLANIILSKLEYTTPNPANKDERDILNHIFSLEYKRQCSKILTISSKVNYTQNHTVFIHKERSSQNNWNKIISYQNGIIINAEKFYYYPSFEVLANYTIYDFETFSQSIRSYSIRQLSYKDTISITIANNLYLTNKVNFRYYEQSKLFWNTFSELPQRQSADISSEWMCRYDFDNVRTNILNNKKIGFGMRLYYLDVVIVNMPNNRNIVYSYAPEALFNFKINKWVFHCNVWCEFRDENKNKRIIPHFNINTGYSL